MQTLRLDARAPFRTIFVEGCLLISRDAVFGVENIVESCGKDENGKIFIPNENESNGEYYRYCESQDVRRTAENDKTVAQHCGKYRTSLASSNPAYLSPNTPK